MIMNSLNFDNHSKTFAFKRIKRFLRKNYPRFVKAYKNESNSSCNRLDIRQFLIILCDWVSIMKHVWSIDRHLKNYNILQVGKGKNPTISLYSKTTKPLIFFFGEARSTYF